MFFAMPCGVFIIGATIVGGLQTGKLTYVNPCECF